MPVYMAGWVNANASVRFGSGFSVIRTALVGSYRITVPPTATSKFLVTTVTPSALHVIARVAAFSKNALDNTLNVDVEIRDLTTNALVDGEFNFIAVERSGP